MEFIKKQKLYKAAFKNRHGLILWASFFLALLACWNIVVTVNKNFELQQKVDELVLEIELLDIENENVELLNEYLETDEYLEAAAREKLGLAAAGETVFLEKNAVLEDLRSPVQVNGVQVDDSLRDSSGWRYNVKQWQRFLFNG